LIECGDKLGDMTTELNPGEYIDEFVSGRSKHYAYKICNRDVKKEPRTVGKVRGITLNYNASQLVNFDVFKDMIINGEPDMVMVRTDKKIKKKKMGRTEGGCAGISLITEPEEMYMISFIKRRRLNDNTSVPFGYI
jgi:hypothetical protein